MSARLAVALLLLGPRAAWACATCIGSAYGDRTFNWAFLGLIMMPFLVGLGIAGVLFSRYHVLHSESGSSRGALTGAAQVIHEESSP